MAKIPKVKEYAIRWLFGQQQDVVSIAKEVSLSESSVQSVLDQILAENPPKHITSPDLMIRHTASKGLNSVSIMTREASEMNDTTKKQGTQGRDLSKSIFKPKSK
jgi:hypothetical protein